MRSKVTAKFDESQAPQWVLDLKKAKAPPVTFITNQTYLFGDDDIRVTSDPSTCDGWLDSMDEFGLDTEDNALDPHTGDMLLISVGDFNNRFVIDCCTTDPRWMFRHLENPDKVKVGQYLKYDHQMFRGNYNVDIANIWDTNNAEEIIYNGYKEPDGSKWPTALDDLSMRYLGINMDKSVRKNFWGRPRNSTFTSREVVYSADDITYLPFIKFLQEQRIREYGLENVVTLENEATLSYADMEYNGIYMNPKYWATEIVPFYTSEREELRKILDEMGLLLAHSNGIHRYDVKSQALGLFGESVTHWQKSHSVRRKKSRSQSELEATRRPSMKEVFVPTVLDMNWESDKQQIDFFRDVTGIDLFFKDNKKGVERESVNKAVLLRNSSPQFRSAFNDKKYEKARALASNIFEYLLCYREVSKVVGTYGNNLIAAIHPSTGRLHGRYHQLGPDSGRASSSDPNMQNMPATPRFRNGFQAQEGFLICADFSGMELRLIAEAAEEPTMTKAFNDKEDVHSFLASQALGIPVSNKEDKPGYENKAKRSQFKTVNFRLAYGGSEYGMADDFGGVENARHFLVNIYFKKFPRIKDWIEDRKRKVYLNGYSRTFPPFSRITWYPKLWEAKEIIRNQFDHSQEEVEEAHKEQGHAQRAGLNQEIQGTGADIMKLATVWLRRWIKQVNQDAGRTILIMCAQVHDEIIVECRIPTREEALVYGQRVKAIMEAAGNSIVKTLEMVTDVDVEIYWKK